MDNLDHNAHSVYLLYYHLVLVIKYRRKVFDDAVSERAKEIFALSARRPPLLKGLVITSSSQWGCNLSLR